MKRGWKFTIFLFVNVGLPENELSFCELRVGGFVEFKSFVHAVLMDLFKVLINYEVKEGIHD